jgi:hypothetical protein
LTREELFFKSHFDLPFLYDVLQIIFQLHMCACTYHDIIVNMYHDINVHT